MTLTQNNQTYISDYIKRALNDSAALEPPDERRCGDHVEMLRMLHEAHTKGGPTLAKNTWETIVRLSPDARILESGGTKLVHADDLGGLPQPMYLLQDYPIYSSGFNVLAGKSGAGKSFVALDISGRLAKYKAVVYVAGEGLGGYYKRWLAWKDFYHVTEKTQLYFYIEAIQLLDQAQLEMFIADIGRHDPVMVVIDTLARSAVGMDENSARDMGQFVFACDHIRQSLNTAVLVVHHTGNNGRIRGSSALYAAADSVMFVQQLDNYLRILNGGDEGKNKYNKSAKEMTYQIKDWDVISPEGKMLDGAVLEKVDVNLIDLNTDSLTDYQRAILEALEFAGDEGLSAKEILDVTDIPKTSVYRNANKLAEANLIDKSSGNYVITDDGISRLKG